MLKVIFPENTGQKYYSIHYQYIIDLFLYNKCDIILMNIPEPYKNTFECYINGVKVLFDYNDNSENNEVKNSTECIFKFHYVNHQINIFPFCPVSFYHDDWMNMKKLQSEIKYTCNNDIILSPQRPYGKATERRIKVQEMLSNKYGSNFDNKRTTQDIYWHKINNCLTHVFVPGYSNNMCDRGQLQYMFFGCCVISPELPEILPYNLTFMPNVDYIMCKNDYSDLIEKIEYVKNNRKKAIEIGNNAKETCKNFYPENLINYIKDMI